MSSAEKTNNTVRYHSLDALRAFALLLGVVFHAAESFMAGHKEWAIVDCSTSVVLDIFRHACHSFRLAIFFLIAGFFAHLLYNRRGWRRFAQNRFHRIFIPLVVGWFVLYPMLVFIWLCGALKSGNWSFIGIPEEARHLSPTQLTIGFFLTGQFIRRFDLTHLWFLHQLLSIYICFLVVRAALVRLIDRDSQWRSRLDRLFAAIVNSRWKIVLLAIPTLPLLLLMDSWNVDTPKTSLLPHIPTTLLFGFFFGVGWMLYRQPGLTESLATHWRRNLLLGLVLVLPSRYLAGFLFSFGTMGQFQGWIRLAHSTIYALMMWAFVFGFSGLFIARCNTDDWRWRYVADSSYWIYLAHLPVVVTIQVWLAHVEVHWTAKFVLFNLIAFPVLFLSYHYLVRSTFIGAQLNGRRYPFERFRGLQLIGKSAKCSR